MIERHETARVAAGDERGAHGSSPVTDGTPTAVETLAEGSQATPLPVVERRAAHGVLADGTRPILLHVRSTQAPRRIWPRVVAAAAVVVAGIAAFTLLTIRRDRVELDRQFPIVADANERASLDHDAARWSHGEARLLGNLARFSPPALDAMTGAGACTLAIDESTSAGSTTDPDAATTTRAIVLPGETTDGLDVLARDEIARMIAAADRGRFRTEAGRLQITRSLASAFVVAKITSTAPLPGPAAGIAYAFDPATGALRCAGSFQVEAPDPSLDPDAAAEMFEADTMRAVAAALRAVD